MNTVTPKDTPTAIPTLDDELYVGGVMSLLLLSRYNKSYIYLFSY